MKDLPMVSEWRAVTTGGTETDSATLILIDCAVSGAGCNYASRGVATQ